MASGRADPADPAADARFERISEIGPWTLQCLGLFGRGEFDSLPAGDLAYVKLVGVAQGLGRRAMVSEVEEFYARYEPFRALAGVFSLSHYSSAQSKARGLPMAPDHPRRRGLADRGPTPTPLRRGKEKFNRECKSLPSRCVALAGRPRVDRQPYEVSSGLMATRVVILGAGFAGLELATRLSESAADEFEVTLIDRNDSFGFGFSKLDLLLGLKSMDEVRLPYDRVNKPGVTFLQETITEIDPGARRVKTDGGAYDADILAIALGADYDFAATRGWNEDRCEYYSFAGAERMRDVVAGFGGGRIVIGILGHPYKCPPAPFEGAFLLHDQLVERGVREKCEIRVIGPMAAPVPVTEEVSQAFLGALGERDIEYVAKQTIERVDPDRGEAHLGGDESVAFDLFVGIPVHRVPEVVSKSGLAPGGWIPVARDNLATEHEGVYALGDCTSLPMAKAGVFAENAAGVVADDIIAKQRGGTLERRYEGIGSCYLEFGGGRVAKVQANFLGGPLPTGQLVGPSLELADEKREFARSREERWF